MARLCLFLVLAWVLLAGPAAQAQQLSAPQLQGGVDNILGHADPRPTTPPTKPDVLAPSWRYNVDIADRALQLGPVDEVQLRQEDAQRALVDKILRFGVGRDVNVSLSDGKWYVVPDAGLLWVFDIEAAGAMGIRVRLSDVELPDSAEVYLYAPVDPGRVTVYQDRTVDPGEQFWSPTMFSSRVRIEYFLPKGVGIESTKPFVVDRIQHIYRDPVAELHSAQPFGAGPCHNDVSCFPAYDDLAKAVSGTGFIVGDSLFCTGNLLATSANDLTPYLLTANHCISTQSTAETVEVYWLYQTSTCNGSPPSLSSVPQSAVTTLLATNAASDYTLLMVEGELPTGLFWAGWSAAAVPNGTPCTGIHHPSGDYKRISFGTKDFGTTNFITIDWFDGPTEPGSSGSGIFLTSTQQLVGQLCCGSSACGNLTDDDYGAFSASFSGISSLLNVGTDDASEPNDSCAGAATTPAGTYSNRVVKTGDEDWYAISVPGSSTLDVDLLFTDAHGDVDAQLFSSCGGSVVASATSSSNNESLSFFNSGGTTTFFLRVFLASDTRNEYTLIVDTGVGGGPSNDSCSTPLTVSVGTTNFDSTNATTDGPDEPGSCSFFGYTHIESDLWFCFTPSSTGDVTVSLCGSGYDTKLGVYEGCICPSSAPIACNDDACSGALQSEVMFAGVAGQDYMIRVGGYQGATGTGTLEISVDTTDTCADATPVTEGSFAFTNVGATTDGPDEPGSCDFFGYTQIGADVWFSYVASCSGDVTVSLCGSLYDTKLAVYAGSTCPTTASAFACNDDACSGALQSEVTFGAMAGESFLIRVGGYQAAEGTGTLTISCETTNDDCTGAIVVGDGSTTGMLDGATNDADASCGTSNSSPDVWFSYTATCNGVLEVDTCGTNDIGGTNQGIDTVLALYSGCPGTLGTELVCNDDWQDSDPMSCTGIDTGALLDSHVSLPVTLGQNIRIRVSNFNNGGTGSFNLNVNCTPTGGGGPANDDCTSAPLIGDGAFAGTLTGATNDGTAACGSSAANADVWYEYVAPAAGTLFVNTCGTNDTGGVDAGVDTVLSVHSACGLAALECNDDWPSGSDPTACSGSDSGLTRDSAIAIALTNGQTVLIRVSHFGTTTPGDFVLQTSFDSTCLPVTGLSCVTGASVNLSWTNGDSYTAIRVFRDSTLIATLAGSATSFNDTPPTGGTQVYEVEGDCGGGNIASPASCVVNFSPTCNPVSNLQCSITGSDVTLTWTNGDSYTAIRVFRDGSLIATLPGTTTSTNDTNLAPGTYAYTVEGDCGGSIANPADCIADTASTGGLRRGDCNHDGSINIADAVSLLGFLFPTGGPPAPLSCEDACDGNDDGSLNIADAVAVLTALFGNPTAPLPAPYPGCGDDPSPDSLNCAAYSFCP